MPGTLGMDTTCDDEGSITQAPALGSCRCDGHTRILDASLTHDLQLAAQLEDGLEEVDLLPQIVNYHVS